MRKIAFVLAAAALMVPPKPVEAEAGNLPDVPEGMKRWSGGSKPTDWTGEAVQFRSGEIMSKPPAGTVWKLGWGHHYGDGDIIAYSISTPDTGRK